MEIIYLAAILIVAISSLTVIYFIVKANTESNREIINKLANQIMAEDMTEYLALTESDKTPTKKPEPQEPRYVPMDEMGEQDWDKAIKEG